MTMNSFGTLFRLTDFGETHGECLGGIIDGCPAGIIIDETFIQNELQRRVPQGDGSTQRKEPDKLHLLSGIFEGKTTGAPIAFQIMNRDGRPNREADHLLKPSHASFVLKEKYGHHCNEQGGRYSGRQTVCRVVAGAIAKLILAHYSIKITSEVISTAPSVQLGDTVGARVRCQIDRMPAGCGSPYYDGFDARLAAAMLSIPACKGFEIGEGFAATQMSGSQYNDRQNPDFSFQSNHDGGVQSGITNGQPIIFNVAFKPIPTLQLPQTTIDYEGNEVIYHGNNRNDCSVVPRVLPVVEAMAAMVAVDMLLLQRSDRM